jgi:hypothetical protein
MDDFFFVKYSLARPINPKQTADHFAGDDLHPPNRTE